MFDRFGTLPYGTLSPACSRNPHTYFPLYWIKFCIIVLAGASLLQIGGKTLVFLFFPLTGSTHLIRWSVKRDNSFTNGLRKLFICGLSLPNHKPHNNMWSFLSEGGNSFIIHRIGEMLYFDTVLYIGIPSMLSCNEILLSSLKLATFL